MRAVSSGDILTFTWSNSNSIEYPTAVFAVKKEVVMVAVALEFDMYL